MQQKLPNEQFIYYGDTAHLPYGDKSEEALQSYVQAILHYLHHRNCKFVVVACNSAATVIRNISKLPFRPENIVEVISPVVDLIAKQTKYTNIGIIGTRKTIGSGMFNDTLSKKNPKLNLIARATPLLVPLIEDGFIDENVLFPVFQRYFKGFEKCELLIPACTHYPIIYRQIEHYFDYTLKVLHTPKIVAESVEAQLKILNIAHDKLAHQNSDEFHLSDVTDDFVRSATFFLEKQVHFQRTLLSSIH